MKKQIFRLLSAAALLLSLSVSVSAAELQYFSEDASISSSSDSEAMAAESAEEAVVLSDIPFSICTGTETDGTAIHPQKSDDRWVLLLPASADASALPLNFTTDSTESVLTVTGDLSYAVIADGDTVDLTMLCSGKDEAGCYELSISDGTTTMELSVHFSDTVAALYLTSEDPDGHGREWVESSADKTNIATGSMVLQNPDGSVVYSGALTQIKGRGNSTWGGAKKPYQIKLDKKTDLLETGDSSNKNKTWVLLANYFDATMLRNAITFDLAAALNMDFTPEYRFVDLYYDGEYRGSYLLCEKVAVGSGRINITDLESENEDANPDIEDFSLLTAGTGKTENGCEYHYWYDMANPDNISGGYLLEMDFASRAEEEACYFKSSRGTYVTVKSPEYCSASEMDYIASLYQEFEDTVYAGGTNPTTGKALSEYADMTSVADYYLINEYSKNCDSYESSCYLYKDADSDLFYMGPVWDYDLAYGYTNYASRNVAKGPKGWVASNSSFGTQLWNCNAFRIAVYREYRDRMLPLLNDTLLGDEAAVTTTASGRTLHSFAWYKTLTAGTASSNYVIWTITDLYEYFYGGYTYESNMEYTEDFLTRRTVWLQENLAGRIYTDVSAGRWYTTCIADITAAGLMNGRSSNTFDPDGELTRAETAQIIYNIAGRPDCTDTMTFTDVRHDAWYAPALAWCTEQGVLQGYPDDTARPNLRISRQDFVCLMYRYNGSPEVDGNALETFEDAASVSDYARDAMEWAVENGVLSGYTNGKLCPQANIRRSECASILVRLNG